MSFTDVDPILNRWSADKGIRIDIPTNGTNRRFFHFSSKNGETFQVVIEPPAHGSIRIDAHLIESTSSTESHFFWEIPTHDLGTCLKLIYDSLIFWFSRNN